jgi:hypothetical protein
MTKEATMVAARKIEQRSVRVAKPTGERFDAKKAVRTGEAALREGHGPPC